MLEKAVATAIAAVAPRNATAWFRHCGYLLSDTATPEPPTMISMSNSLALQGGRAPHQQVRVRLHPTGLPGLLCMRAGLDDLPVIESQLPHPLQAHRQLAGNGHNGNGAVLLHRQPQIMPSPARLESHRDMRRLHQLLRFRLANDAAVAHNSGCSSCSTLHRDVDDRVGPRATPSFGQQRCMGAALARPANHDSGAICRSSDSSHR